MAESDFDARSLRQIAEVYEGAAVAHRQRASRQDEGGDSTQPRRGRRLGEWSQDDMLAASGLVISASCWSLVEPRRASILYQQAAATYRQMEHGFWTVLALASGNREEIALVSNWIDEHRQLSRLTLAFGMIGDALGERDNQGERSERLNAGWRHFGNVPVGRLGIPLDIYGECAKAMGDPLLKRKTASEFFLRAARDYVGRAAEIRRAASHDSFHWKRLMSTVLPAEPEAVAMTVAMSTMSRRMFRRPLVELMPDLETHGRILVEVGDEMSAAGL